jgi:ASC-1-like (ASCH) protein
MNGPGIKFHGDDNKETENFMNSNPKILKFRAVDKDIFEAILAGSKKIETRAATEKYRNLKAGDTVVLACGKKRVERKIKKVELFRSMDAVLGKYGPEEYGPEDINPKTHTIREIKKMWLGFPGYKDKIKKHGFVVMSLE